MRGFVSSMIKVMLVFLLIGCSASGKKEADADANVEKSTISYANNMSSFNEIINSETPVLVDFYADWCAPCRMVAPILEQVAGDMKGKVRVIKVNVDKNQDAAVKYGVQSIPTLILFQNGEVRWRGLGVMQADQIKQIVTAKSTITQ